MKKLWLLTPVFLLFACGESKPTDETLTLEKFDDKLAYTLGASSAKDLLSNVQISGNKLTKEKVIEGFKMNFMQLPVDDCRPSIEGLFGVNGGDFNTTFLEEGSVCVGRFFSFNLFTELNSFEKASEIDTALLFRGFEDGLFSRDTAVLSMGDQMAINEEFSRTIESLISEKMEEMWGENRTKGEEFLAENAKRDGVITTESGLQYEIVKKGNGPKPTTSNEVTVHYHGTTVDGVVFDSSIDRGEPISFNVLGVIPGWTEALQLMPKGSKFKVYIPQELAYGAHPQPGGPIAPYSALIFDIELIDFK